MTLKEYASLAQRTASTKTNTDKIGHGCLGLIGEAGEIVDIIKKMRYMGMPKELAREKLIDEAGDFGWYLVELCRGLDLQFDVIVADAARWSIPRETLDEAAVDLAGRAIVLYSDDYNVSRFDVEDVVCSWMFILGIADIELDAVLEHNIDKLKKRYPDGFSADRSNERYEHE